MNEDLKGKLKDAGKDIGVEIGKAIAKSVFERLRAWWLSRPAVKRRRGKK